MTSHQPAFPYRHATRLVNACQLRIGVLGLTAFGNSFEASLLFFMIYRDALRAPGDPAISVNRIATSLKQSTETMRRAARQLVDQGLCVRLERGVERSATFFHAPEVQRIGIALEEALLALLADYARSGFPLPAGVQDQPREANILAAIDIHLSVIELVESRVSKPVLLHVVGTVAVLNAATLVQDARLGLLYGHDDTDPPDAVRHPARLSQIAAESGLPTTTVWRHLSAAEKQGAVRRVDGGYLLGGVYMQDPVTSARSREKIAYVHRVFHDLAHGRYGRPSSTA